RVRLQRRAAEKAGCRYRIDRQAADRLRLSPLHRQLPADRARRTDDRADRDGEQARTGSFLRSDDFDCERDRRGPRDGEARAILNAHIEGGRSNRGEKADGPLEALRSTCRRSSSTWLPRGKRTLSSPDTAARLCSGPPLRIRRCMPTTL